jgi:hypothetical protein
MLRGWDEACDPSELGLAAVASTDKTRAASAAGAPKEHAICRRCDKASASGQRSVYFFTRVLAESAQTTFMVSLGDCCKGNH